jgi:hypothetical protein
MPTKSAENIDGAARGRVTDIAVLADPAPLRYAASSNEGSVVRKAGRTIRYINGTSDNPKTQIIPLKEKALKTGPVPKTSRMNWLRIPDRGASRKIQAMLSIIGGIRSGTSGRIETKRLRGKSVRVTIHATGSAKARPKIAEPAE